MSAVYEWGYTIDPSVDISALDAQSAYLLWEQEIGPTLVAARNAFRDQEMANGYTTTADWQAVLNRGSRTLVISREYTELTHAQARQAWTEANIPTNLTSLTQNLSRCIDGAELGLTFVTTDS